MPTITVSIPDDTYARLTAESVARNQTVEEVVALDQLSPRVPTPDERQRAFDELTRLIRSRADRYPPGFRVEDSREGHVREARGMIAPLDTNVLLRYANPHDPNHVT